MEEKHENQNYQNFSKLKGIFNEGMNNAPIKSGVNKNKNLNNKILEKNVNFKTKSNIDINDNNMNINYNDANNNIDNIINKMKANDILDPLESNLPSNIYEKNISILNDKIKEQENDIKYLNERLKNYDATMDEMAKLNIELNRLNEIIKRKNNTIQEYREITELSKKKFDELIDNKKELIQKIKDLQKENDELRNKYKYKNNFIREEYIPKKPNIDDIQKENQELKRQLKEKGEKIKYMKSLLEKTNFNNNNSNRYINYTPHQRNFNYDINYRNGNVLKTEPTNFNNMPNSYSTYGRDIGINKYNYLKNKYNIVPLKYSNYLLDNLQTNIRNNYLNIK